MIADWSMKKKGEIQQNKTKMTKNNGHGNGRNSGHETKKSGHRSARRSGRARKWA